MTRYVSIKFFISEVLAIFYSFTLTQKSGILEFNSAIDFQEKTNLDHHVSDTNDFLCGVDNECT